MRITVSLILLPLLLLGFTLYSQSISEVKSRPDKYLFAEGQGRTISSAERDAMQRLINQIFTVVEHKFEIIREEDNYDYSETVKSVVNTYSTTRLRNLRTLTISDAPDAKVFVYILRTEIDQLFEHRKNKIYEFVNYGNSAYENIALADALQYYYWAYTLLISHPDGSSMRICPDGKSSDLLSTWLNYKIRKIIRGVDVSIVELQKHETFTNAVLRFTYNDRPVTNIAYRYWDGRSRSQLNHVTDIGGAVFAPIDDISEVQLNIEYIFESEARSDLELYEVMNLLEPIHFDNRKIARKIEKKEAEEDSPEIKTQKKYESDKLYSIIENTCEFDKIINKLVNAINRKNYESVRHLFTPEAYSIFLELIAYGNAKVLSHNNLNYLKFNDNIICRSVQMSFSFHNNTRTFVEDVVISFAKDKKINNMVFGLGEVAINDILNQTAWNENIRLSLIDFMEHYKTAFALKRLDYVESIFADDALIITGWVTETQPSVENPFADNRIVRYNRLDKSQYLSRLQRAFASNEFINIRFNDNNIRRRGTRGDVYGIQIQQDYFSSNYGDSGYLFLLIDMEDTSKPIIHVRTWQPEKNPDGSIYGVEDF